MTNATACAHKLHVARRNYPTVAKTVSMLKRTFHHIADDLHVLMGVRGKACARDHAIIVDDTKRAKSHLLWIKVGAERESVTTIEPARPGAPAILIPTLHNHVLFSLTS